MRPCNEVLYLSILDLMKATLCLTYTCPAGADRKLSYALFAHVMSAIYLYNPKVSYIS